MNESDVKRSVSAQEWQARVDLAAAYRLTALFGWDDLVYTHISMRIPGTHAFLLNPYGMMFDEITASSLVKIDLDGNKLAPSEYDINPAGFTIHSAVHAAREDVACVMHTHSLNGVAVSAQADGLLPISQQALLVMRSLAYHDYEGIAVEADEKPRLVRDLGERNVMLLRNHGLLTVGASAAAAFVGMYFAEAACAIQVRAQAGGGALRMIPQPILDGIARQSRITTRDMGPEQLVWPGLLRRLDRRNPGYAS
ncbi:class II aldolase/adducin family protein [Burkholderia multivorans]|uniref:class II aldolase/adducin family protein n=1 Tax=Burkholderia multivorans TaxID=87883 RepID=UPI000CFF427D|nr:class II aldolase/adducin family protein [Burkholderia multivorans]MBR7895404.1 class II aldolase/adducin family protein [Burkholderia multivorans]MBR8453977.1 class II aldolase/adducin family protein [Burkholderia multivorans]MBU9450860.1 class II aldolase/adducin family protein [Burkholderia multivorans]MCL4645791.1 class II aldolase/adducin family protein [Burkholderia multivorans]PRG31652.1 class II aldolase [Burkholderia multivorans]